MKNCGRATAHEYLGDLVVYRNLAPLDSCLPDLEAAWKQLESTSGLIPRRDTPAWKTTSLTAWQAA